MRQARYFCAECREGRNPGRSCYHVDRHGLGWGLSPDATSGSEMIMLGGCSAAGLDGNACDSGSERALVRSRGTWLGNERTLVGTSLRPQMTRGELGQRPFGSSSILPYLSQPIPTIPGQGHVGRYIGGRTRIGRLGHNPDSHVRRVKADSTVVTNTLPSPGKPVEAAAWTELVTVSIWLSSTTTINIHLTSSS